MDMISPGNISSAALETHKTSDPHPTVAEKAALAGTNGAPSSENKYVTNTDPRLIDVATDPFLLMVT